ncbi:TetR/AcrR family transcriptional regulator [Luteococcus sp. OSA5]|uniref:TetR/AcrR family transcriptional regulator n=1 Tax=Luteococcus sp. OSA5 TaxID=3401630 RepID=UPI003B43468E
MSTRPPVRDRLLDAADALFFQAGAIATPVDKVLAQAGASPSSLYAHFGNKDGLLAAALERRLEVWTQVWDRALAQADTPQERLMSIFPALRTYQGEHMTERWCAFSGTAATVPTQPPRIADILQRETQMLRERFLTFASEVTLDRPEALARAMMITYTGTTAMMLRVPWSEAIHDGEMTARTLIAAHQG